MKQQAIFKISGIQRDVSDSGFDKQHAYDLRNMVLHNNVTGTLSSLVTELGNKKAQLKNGEYANVSGVVIGTAVLNNTAILFTHELPALAHLFSATPTEVSGGTDPSNTSTDNVIPGGDITPGMVVTPDEPIDPEPIEPDPIIPTPDPLNPDAGKICDYTVECSTARVSKNDWNRVSYVEVHALAGEGASSVNGTALVKVTITKFYNIDLINGLITIDCINNYSQVSFKREGGEFSDSPLTITAEDAANISSSNPYVFYIKYVTKAASAYFDNTEEWKDTVVSYNTKLMGPAIIKLHAFISEPNGVQFDYTEELDTTECDHIYLVTANDDKTVDIFEFFRGNLNFDTEHPIEATVYFENEEIQKVYWVDGKNPLRYANIANKNGVNFWSDNLMFESVPVLHLQENVTVTRNSTGGVFPSGTVQFAFTYMNRYGAESNIAWISPIHYSSPDSRGGAPDETCSNSFTIKILKHEPGIRFDYIRLYHILRTSLDGAVEVKRIADLPISELSASGLSYTDTNTTGAVVDPNELLYLGGVSIIPNTIEQKSNTLFLGNLVQQFSYLRDAVDDMNIQDKPSWGSNTVTFGLQATDVVADTRSGYYSHHNQLVSHSWNITSFRRGESYRFGFQAQDKTGRWSDVWWVSDAENTSATPEFSDGVLKTVCASYELDSSFVQELRDLGYRRLRPVVVYPEPWERNIFTEGLLNPTVYNVKDRSANAPFAQSSWFLRPFPPVNVKQVSVGAVLDKDGNIVDDDYRYPFSESDAFRSELYVSQNPIDGVKWLPSLAIDSLYDHDWSMFGSVAEFRHNYPLGDIQQRNGEIQSMYNYRPSYDDDNGGYYNLGQYCYTFPFAARGSSGSEYENNCRDFVRKYADFFYVDQSILTMNSADIEFDQVLQAQKLDGYKFRIVGMIPISSFMSSYDIRTNTPTNKFYTKDNDSMSLPVGLYASENVCASMGNDTLHGFKSFISAPIWHDDVTWHSANNPKPKIVNGTEYDNKEKLPIGFAVYPWQGSGSLNNDNIGTRKVYPSDSNDGKEESKSAVGDNYISAELKTKTLANLHYSLDTHYATSISSDTCFELDAVSRIVLDEQQVTLTKLDGLDKYDGKFDIPYYFGSVDKLITPVTELLSHVSVEGESDADDYTTTYPMSRKGGYPIMVSSIPLFMRTKDNPSHYAFRSPYTPLSTVNTLFDVTGTNSLQSTPFKLKEGSDRKMTSIPIKYKSCNHIVVALDNADVSLGNTSVKAQQVLGWYGHNWNDVDTDVDYLDRFGFADNGVYPSIAPFWNSDGLYGSFPAKLFSASAFNSVYFHHYNSDNNNIDWITFDDNSAYPQGFLYMGQLYRTDITNKFGGTSDEALELNNWLPAGPSVYLRSDANDTDKKVVLVWQAGDTYYQRYDALRTYPFTEEDMNKVVDIVSFMTETHTNIDGRYDKNRGLSNNNLCRPTNFNLINYAYSQRDNFFSYHSLNRKKVHLDTFNYSFTWTRPKMAGSLRDEWTRITLASTYDCDGNKGALNSIVRLDNNLIAFQDNGVAQILFNETSQIQGTDGLPFELANSGKMQGLRYYTTETGCQNKWSIAVAPNGVYWIDGNVKEFYSLGGEGIVRLSTLKKMSSWFAGRTELSTPWNPGDTSSWRGYKSNYDRTTGEVFITSKDECLCYNTQYAEFSGFFDYRLTSDMFALDGTVFTIAQDRSNDTNYPYALWLHRSNKKFYCNFYNEQCMSYVEIVCGSNNEGSDYGMNKVFDNVHWRSDAWRWNVDKWDFLPFKTFTYISGYDNYQTFGKNLITLDDPDSVQPSHPSMPLMLRKKFDIWHTTIPRAVGTYRDRIRDTWCHIRLTANKSTSQRRHIIHDIVVSYFIP